MEYCDKERHLDGIIDVLIPNIIETCLNPHGTRVIQKLIELINQPNHIEKVIKQLQNNVVLLAGDLNGNHVL